MARFFLHIGLMKTGTTALQRTLAQNYDELMRDGVLYPKTARFDDKHVQLVWACQPDDKLGVWARSKYDGRGVDDVVNDINDEVVNSGCSKCVLSAEDFSLRPPEYYRMLADKLNGDINVIVYIRNHADLIESMYRQLLKGRGISKTFDAFLKDSLSQGRAGGTSLFYKELVDGWAEVFGKGNIVVREYKGGRGYSTVDDFMDCIGASPLPNRSRGFVVNPSLHGPYLEFVRAINQHLSGGVRSKIMNEVIALVRSHPCEPSPLLTEDEKSKIMETFAHDEKEVLAAYPRSFDFDG
ncbi:hypothetical protein SAMN05444398_102103 [Roseovarius pacificus]|uniref:Sulfotransferase family protein n=2 Tax=Roseovarius pacificus TaxID=337701 RepID=A0A1M6ZYI4_9RHOB|nr:hypothetical protein [Roseovarius pacificus]SHL35476.1 hypothetical protein SAMN05444398_102103 [Roseovarius pacificus]